MKRIIFILFIAFFLTTGEAQTIISGIDTTLTVAWGYNIFRRTSVDLLIENSKFTQTNTEIYILQIGDDGYTTSTALNLNGARIAGNYLSYTNSERGNMHAMIAGYNIDYQIFYNYIDSSYYGIVAEGGYNDGTPMINNNYSIRGNIFRNNVSPLIIWGYQNMIVNNNTFYNNRSDASWAIKIGESNGTTIPAYSKNITIVNNLVYLVDVNKAIYITTTSDTGLVVDYNVYYCVNAIDNEPRFAIDGVDYTWAQWRALGYDTHSVIIDPVFNNTYDLVPSARFNYGTDLGTGYDYALSTQSDWVVGHSPDTIQQNGTWQVGARIYDLTPPSLTAYYVSTTGSDDNPGTYELPWLSWQKAFDTAQPGDTVYFREGTWYLGAGEKVTYDPTGDYGFGVHGNKGTRDNWIVFMNYPGETPILDGTYTTKYEELFGAWYTSYVLFKGLTWQNKWQYTWNQIIRQAVFYNNGNIIIENCTSRYSGGYGFTINAWDTLYVHNCDSYEHYNVMSDDPGNKPDGFAIASGGEYTDYGVLRGCRAWRCSDDGFEASWSPFMLIDSCWSFCNGFLSGGQGIGIKYGEGYIENADDRITQRCIVAWNKGAAFSFQNLSTEQNGPIGNFYNNLAYHNKLSFTSVISDYFTNCETGDTYLNFINNACYGETLGRPINLMTCGVEMINYKWFSSHNTWYLDPANQSYKYQYNDTLNWAATGKEDQWVLLPDSITTINLLGAPRKANGSLPDIGNAFKLSPTSTLIDAGIDVGLPYSGSAPDIGVFEYIPSVNVAIENAYPAEFKLYQNYPNPFNPSTTIKFDLPRSVRVKLEIYNIIGQKIQTIFDGIKVAGSYEIVWNASNLSTGIYYYRIRTKDFTDVKKVLLLK